MRIKVTIETKDTKDKPISTFGVDYTNEPSQEEFISDIFALITQDINFYLGMDYKIVVYVDYIIKEKKHMRGIAIDLSNPTLTYAHVRSIIGSLYTVMERQQEIEERN